MYKDDRSFDERVNEAMRILSKYPERVPMIVEKAPDSNLPDIDRKKWLVPKDMTVGQWLSLLRRTINLKASEGLFVMVNDKLPTSSASISEVYEENKDDDCLLYWVYREMSTFG